MDQWKVCWVSYNIIRLSRGPQIREDESSRSLSGWRQTHFGPFLYKRRGNPEDGLSFRISRTSYSLSRACRRIGRPAWKEVQRYDVGRQARGKGAWQVGASLGAQSIWWKHSSPRPLFWYCLQCWPWFSSVFFTAFLSIFVFLYPFLPSFLQYKQLWGFPSRWVVFSF